MNHAVLALQLLHDAEIGQALDGAVAVSPRPVERLTHLSDAEIDRAVDELGQADAGDELELEHVAPVPGVLVWWIAL